MNKQKYLSSHFFRNQISAKNAIRLSIYIINKEQHEHLKPLSINFSTRLIYPASCADFDEDFCADSKCHIVNYMYDPKPFLVSCNHSVDGGGWTVIQRRINGSVNFYRNWNEYKNGFGDIDGEFFIGLDKLHALITTFSPVELLIQLEDFANVTKFAKYDDFQIGSETEYYKLFKVGKYSGDAGDSLRYHEGSKFSTKDRDNDGKPSNNCAIEFTGGWWYNDCYHRSVSIL